MKTLHTINNTQITSDMVDSMMKIAFNNPKKGVGYWADIRAVNYPNSDEPNDYPWQVISKGGSLNLLDKNNLSVYILDRAHLFQGLELFYNSKKGKKKKFVFDFNNFTEKDVDQIVQYSIFQEIEYDGPEIRNLDLRTKH